MTEDRSPAFEALLDEALRLPLEQRSAFIDQACAGDEALRAALARELSSGGETVVLTDRPVVSEPLDAQVASGTRLGPWEIIHRIGQGGMGEVYLARRADGAFELEVAIKLLKRGYRKLYELVSATPRDEVLERARAYGVPDDLTEDFVAAQKLYSFGYNEKRGADIYNTVVVAHRGHLLGTYSKCAAYQPFHKQGRSFPVWEHHGLKFGVLIHTHQAPHRRVHAPHLAAARQAGLYRVLHRPFRFGQIDHRQRADGQADGNGRPPCDAARR